MVRFKDIQALRAHLEDWEEGYADYANSLWSNGRIWSTETLASSPLETLSRILASGGDPLPYHTIHAADLIARAKASGEEILALPYSLPGCVIHMDFKANDPKLMP